EAEGGLHAFHLGALMGGKGSVVCAFDSERRRHEAALRLRRGAFHNITTKVRDKNHSIGKPASFDGVLVEAPSSGVGHWRRHPDGRWAVAAEQIPQYAGEQARLLDLASTRVRWGGTLVYTVPTLMRAETAGVVDAFLQSHPDYQLQPFPHPLEETTAS